MSVALLVSSLLTIIGLMAFEAVSSLDNAVVNAQVLGTVKNAKAKKFFLTWGIFFAIFVVRGLLPLIIVYLASPSLGLWGVLSATFSGDEAAHSAIEAATPLLMLSGGSFLALLFLHWFLVEDKIVGLPVIDKALKYGGVWFHAIAAISLTGLLVIIANNYGDAAPLLMVATTIGFTAFFVADGFKRNAEHIEEELLKSGKTESGLGDWAKILFLEVIDLSFSIDGVVGAFAFTTSIPLILIGNGLGAVIVRQLTIGNIERIKRYSLLSHGAMYSIGVLASVMLLEGFGISIPAYVSPIATISLIAVFFWKSYRQVNGPRPTLAV